jgi:hypothetical protein
MQLLWLFVLYTVLGDQLYVLTASEDCKIRAYSLARISIGWRVFLSAIIEGHISVVKCLSPLGTYMQRT